MSGLALGGPVALLPPSHASAWPPTHPWRDGSLSEVLWEKTGCGLPPLICPPSSQATLQSPGLQGNLRTASRAWLQKALSLPPRRFPDSRSRQLRVTQGNAPPPPRQGLISLRKEGAFSNLQTSRCCSAHRAREAPAERQGPHTSPTGAVRAAQRQLPAQGPGWHKAGIHGLHWWRQWWQRPGIPRAATSGICSGKCRSCPHASLC